MTFVLPLVVVLAVAMVLAVALARGPQLLPGVRPYSRTFWCPFRGENVRVEFEEAAWNGRLMKVCRCSAFEPATEITCGKDCLGLAAFPAARPTAV